MLKKQRKRHKNDWMDDFIKEFRHSIEVKPITKNWKMWYLKLRTKWIALRTDWIEQDYWTIQ